MRTLRWIAALLFVAGASLASAQTLPPGKKMGLLPQAKAQIDSIAVRTAQDRTEQAACLTVYGMNDSVFVVAALGPAKNVVKTDSVTVVADGDMCEWWQPSLHSHIVDNGLLLMPSMLDYHTAAVRSVFGLLLSVRPDGTWKLVPYP